MGSQFCFPRLILNSVEFFFFWFSYVFLPVFYTYISLHAAVLHTYILRLLVQMYANKGEGWGHVIQMFAYKLFKTKYLVHKLLAIPDLLLFASKYLSWLNYLP